MHSYADTTQTYIIQIQASKEYETAIWFICPFSLPLGSRRPPGWFESTFECLCTREDEKVKEDTATEAIETTESHAHAVGVPAMNKKELLHV